MFNDNPVPPYFQHLYPELIAQLAELVRPLLADACAQNQRYLTIHATLNKPEVANLIHRAGDALLKKLRQDLAAALGLKPRDITFSMWHESHRLITISTASMRKAADAAFASVLAAGKNSLTDVYERLFYTNYNLPLTIDISYEMGLYLKRRHGLFLPNRELKKLKLAVACKGLELTSFGTWLTASSAGESELVSINRYIYAYSLIFNKIKRQK